MIILITLVIGLIAGIVLYKPFELIGTGLIIMCSTCLLFAIIVLPINRYDVNSKIKEFKSVESTLTTARKNNQNIENAALQMKVIDSNKWLASTQYYKDTIFGLWIPDDIKSLKPIQ